MLKTKFKFVALLLTAGVLASCSSNKTQVVNYTLGDETQLYAKAEDYLKNDKLSSAEPILTQLNLQYPFGQYRSQVEVMQAYTSYKLSEYELTINQTQKYLQNNPRYQAQYGDYMLLLHALASANSNRGLFQGLFGLDRADNDLSNVQAAITDLSDLLNAYPTSSYAAYAKQLHAYLVNLLARHNLEVGQQYLKNNDPLAAYKRANTVLFNFGNTVYAEPALTLLQQSASQLNVDFASEAQALKQRIQEALKASKEGAIPVVLKQPEETNLLPPFLK